MDNSRENLKKFIKEYCVERGQFTLRSGKASSLYIDLRRATLHGSMMGLIGSLLYERVRPHGVRVISGMSLGADPLICATVMEAWKRGVLLQGCFVRSQAKGHGLGQKVEGLALVPKASTAIVLEDTCTTGTSSLEAVAALRVEGLQVLGVISVVHRGDEEVLRKFHQNGLWYDTLFQESEIAD